MTRSRHSIRRGFTLIELLVVIAIIGILAGLLFPAISAALRTAKKNKARAETQSIANAVMLYYNDYGKLPIPDSWHGANLDVPISQANSETHAKNVIQILTAVPAGWNTGHKLNPKRKIYLSMETPSDEGEYLDPWGTQYRMILDRNYDNKIDYLTADDAQHRQKVVVVSAGPDKDFSQTDDNIASVELPEQ